MGYISAVDMRSHLEEEQALIWHLQSNHYPPVNLIFLPMVKEALAHARAGEWDHMLAFPAETRRGDRRVSVSDVVEQMHLDAFLEEEAS